MNVVVGTILTVATLVFSWVTFGGASADTDGATAAIGYVVVLVAWIAVNLVSIVVHELMHALAIVAIGEPVRRIEIGHGPRLVDLPIGRFRLTVRANLAGGGRTYWSQAAGYARRAVVVFAGPLSHVFLLAVALVERGAWPDWLVVLVAGTSVSLLATNLIPSPRFDEPANDGRALVTLVRKRPAPSAEAAAVFNRLTTQTADGNPRELLAFTEKVLATPGLEPGSERITRELRRVALVVAGRYGEAYALTDDPRERAEMTLESAFVTGHPLHATQLASIEEASRQPRATVPGLPSDRSDPAAELHTRALLALFRDQPEEALRMLDDPAVVAHQRPRAVAAVITATRGVALARTGDLRSAHQLLADLRVGMPWSPWIAPLDRAVREVEAVPPVGRPPVT